jgi:hypothetical protein
VRYDKALEIDLDTEAKVAHGELETTQVLKDETDVGDVNRDDSGEAGIVVDEQVKQRRDGFALADREATGWLLVS